MSTAHRRRRRLSRDITTTYLDEIGTFPLLTRQAETELARRARSGDVVALERLICANLRFVVSIAKRYQARGVPLVDLISEGNLGLVQAAQKFDETKGVKFISYAVWWVRQMIFQALAQQGHAVRVPVARAGAFQRLGRRAEELRQELAREPTRGELAAASAVTEDEIGNRSLMDRPAVSLDAALSEGEDATLLDYLTSDDPTCPEEDMSQVALGDSVEQALGLLSPREAHVVRQYFGFDGNEALTLEAIGSQMGITRERARQIKERALRKLRKSIHRETLAAFRE